MIGVASATFLLLHAVPGDPAREILGEHATARSVAALNHSWGLDRSLWHQFVRYIGDLARLRLGNSFVSGTSVTSLIAARIGQTAALVGIATVFAVLITVPLAAVAASHRDRVHDHAVRGLSVLGLGMPSFWVGIVLIEVFAVHLKLLPVGGAGSGIGGHLEALILPGFTAALAIVPLLVRSLRVGMLEVLNADFVAAERANGLGEVRVLVWHVARNALIPTLTLLGLNIAYLVGSTVIVEQVFALNGLGFLLLQSITARDFPVVQAITLVLALSVVAINLVTDLVAARLDPRIRLR